jgi:hypothetical protein
MGRVDGGKQRFRPAGLGASVSGTNDRDDADPANMKHMTEQQVRKFFIQRHL